MSSDPASVREESPGRLFDTDGTAHREYLDRLLSNFPARHRLPTTPSAEPSEHGPIAVHSCFLDSATQTELHRLCETRALQPGVVVGAALVVLVARYAYETDIVVSGLSSWSANEAGRVDPRVHALVLRCNLSETLSFAEHLAGFKAAVDEALIHQTQPNPAIDEALASRSSDDRGPKHQVVFGLDVAGPNPKQHYQSFDLALSATKNADGIRFDWAYDERVLASDTLAAMATHYQALLQAMLRDPTQPVLRAPMLDASTQGRMLAEASGPVAALGRKLCFHELFEQTAKAKPNAIAIELGSEKLCYSALDAKSNQLAHYLISVHGVTPGSLVGVCLESSIEFFVAVLAILKSGAGYLPLDPAHPAERQRFIVADAEPITIVTRPDRRQTLNLSPQQCICPEEAHIVDALGRQSAQNPNARAHGLNHESTAYVIYTSGTTGKPKGVVQTHRTIVNLITAMEQFDGIREPLRTLQLASTCFDVSLQEMGTAWYLGGTLVLLTAPQKRDLTQLLDFLNAASIERVFVTPAVLKWLAQAASQSRRGLPRLRQVFSAGEALTPSPQLTQFLQQHPDVALWNHYGPTETHVATRCRVAPESSEISIGAAVPNLHAIVLGHDLTPAPVGAVGELHIAGPQLASGYLKRPELTAQRFIEHKLDAADSSESPTRWYKTGDLARRTANGNITFLGRADDQVKLRGFRVELSEVEHALQTYPGVEQAAVKLCQTHGGEPVLVAYLVGGVDRDALRAHLAERLPEHQIPTAFQELSRLPITANGKLDRRALPDWDFAAMQRPFRAPHNAIERTLCNLWQQVLGLDRVGTDDHFFQLGGHSLAAMRLLAEASHALESHLPLAWLFEHPTPQQLARRIAEEGRGEAPVALECSSNNEPLPASDAQAGLWLIDRIALGSPHYNVAIGAQLTGPLNVDALANALTEVLARHRSLRTCFVEDESGTLVQRVLPAAQVDIAHEDLSSLRGGGLQRALERAIEAELIRPFDLERDVMLRARLFRLGEAEHVLVIMVHHIAIDGWSLPILKSELRALYRAQLTGREAALPPLPVTYADYCAWQQKSLNPARLDDLLGYWEKQLSGLPPLHALPLDFPRPSTASHQGNSFKTLLDEAVSAELRTVCRSLEATLFMGVHSALAVLLARYGNATDIVVGSPIAHRERAEVAGLIGLFLNSIAVRSDLSGEPSFSELVGQMRRTLLEAYAHQQAPFKRVVERVRPQRSHNHSPIFQVMLAWQDDEGTLDLPGLQSSEIELPTLTSKCDLTISVQEQGAHLELTWEYDTSILSKDSVEGMARHFTLLLKSLTASPEQSVFAAPMLTTLELKAHLSVPRAAPDAGSPGLLHQLFEREAQHAPKVTAVTCGNTSLSYGELNQRANQLAHLLRRKRGVGPGTLVGVCLERSVGWVIAIFGILKAGGAYVPIDPAQPKSRVAFMLEDAQLSTVVSELELMSSLNIDPKRAVCLDENATQTELRAQPDENPPFHLLDVDLAYAIYTSGSSGMPNGVLGTHAAVKNLLTHFERRAPLERGAACTLWTSLSFDVSVYEIMSALLYGRTLHIVEDSHRMDAMAVFETLRTRNIQSAYLPPFFVKPLVAWLMRQPSPPNLRRLLVGVEPLQLSDLVAIRRMLPLVRLFNGYGPTETTVCSTLFEVEAGGRSDCSVSPIGTALSNTQLLVVGLGGALVPRGVTGELYIGGAGLSRGYLNRPDLTRERFVKSPFHDPANPLSSEVLYRTGDLVRALPDGNLVFVGRADTQVKIRGFRIELGEVEHALKACVAVADAAVVTRVTSGDTKQLVAFFEKAKRDATSDAELIRALRVELAQQLPGYMIPDVLIPIAKLPQTPNGKLDQRDLEARARLAVAPVSSAEVPVSEAAQRLRNLWAKVLGLPAESIGMLSDFFELGGDSLAAYRLSSLANKSGFSLDVNAVFKAPTLKDMSETRSRVRRAPLLSPEQGGPQALLPSQRRFLELPHLQRFYIGGFCLDLRRRLDADVAKQALFQVVEHHPSLKTRFTRDHNGDFQGVVKDSPGTSPIFFNWSTIAEHSKEEQEQILAQSWFHEMEMADLEHGPLVKFLVFDRGAERPQQAHVYIHHLLCDGGSAPMLLEDFQVAYEALACGAACAPLEPTAPVAAVAQHIERVATDTNFQATELKYWRSRGLERLRKVPRDTDAADEANTYNSIGFVERALSQEQTEMLLRQLRERAQPTSVLDALLSAAAQALSVWCDNPLVALRTSDARGALELFAPDVDITHTIGWFAAERLIVLEVDSASTALERLDSATLQIGATPHRGLGFDVLCYGSPESKGYANELSGYPLRQVFLNYLGVTTETEHSEGSIFEPVEWTQRQYAKHDTSIRELELSMFGEIRARRLTLRCEYSTNLHHEGSIVSFVEAMASELRSLQHELRARCAL